MPEKIFIAGIGGTFMAGIAQLARARGYDVRGCDAGVYPPMSDLLRSQNIALIDGYLPEHLGADPGTVIIGNALSRGNPLVEHLLNEKLAFCSGPEWLREQVLRQRTVIAIAGTHGKTTTSSILAWLLDCDGGAPGYLIGGKPGNFAQSARLGNDQNQNHFIIEADEYDTAFFDKRAKFVHYCPHIAVLNNLEFDHADIYDNIEQIQKQFHHLLRLVPSNGWVVVNVDDPRLAEVMALGCWSQVVGFSIAEPSDNNAEWRAVPLNADCSRFEVLRHQQPVAQVNWQCIGQHNMQNALAALAAAALAGTPPELAAEYLSGYCPADRRLQLLFESAAVCLYDDFAHHPTAIRHTIAALRAKHPGNRIIAVVELRSNTMKAGVHGQQLTHSLALADCAIVSGGSLPADDAIIQLNDADEIMSALKSQLRGSDTIITMSNGGFDGLPMRIADFLATTL